MQPEGTLPYSKNPSFVPNRSQTNPFHALTSDFFKIHFNIILLSGHFPSDFPIKTLHAHYLSTIRATCFAHPIILGFNNQIIFSVEYKISSLCSLLQYPITSPLRPKYLLQHPILIVRNQVSHPY
jgi:hypothetical protein